MPQVKNFFKHPEVIVSAIKKAETYTSGEIKVHIDKLCDKDVMEKAKEIFHQLGMHLLPGKNGVLIYISVLDHKIGILGDENIHQKVGDGFWNDELQKMIDHFKKNEYDEGVMEAISDIGQKLQAFFPFDSTNDTNDLNDDISYGH